MGDFDTRAKLAAALGKEPPVTAGGQYRRGPAGASTPVTKTADGFAEAPLGREQTEDGRQFVNKERAVWIIHYRLLSYNIAKLPQLKKGFEAVRIVSGKPWREALQREYPKTWHHRLNIQGFTDKHTRNIWVNREKQDGLGLVKELVKRLREDIWLGQSRSLNDGLSELYARKLADWHNDRSRPQDKIVFDEGAHDHHHTIAVWLEKLATEPVLAGSFFGGDIQPVKTALDRSRWVHAKGGYNWFIQQTKIAQRSVWESLIEVLKSAVNFDDAGPQKTEADKETPGQVPFGRRKPGQEGHSQARPGHRPTRPGSSRE